MPSPLCLYDALMPFADDAQMRPGRGSRMTDSSPAGRRVLFYSHDGTGLGHLRITLGVATAYAKLRPQDSLLLLTGSLQTGAFALPDNLDYVKLPAMPKRDLYASLPPTEGYTGSHNSTIRFRTALALATIQAFDPHLVVIDHAPAGLFRELAPSIDWLRRRDPAPSLALLMRDITFGPEQTRSIWTNEGVYPLLDEAYDRILVYGDRRVFDPIAAYGMSELAASRTRFCGYLAPSPPRRSPAQVREEVGAGNLPLVAVSVGGGGDGGLFLRTYLAGLRDCSRRARAILRGYRTAASATGSGRDHGHDRRAAKRALSSISTQISPPWSRPPMPSSAWEATIRLPSRCTLASGRSSCPGCQGQKSKFCGPRDSRGWGWQRSSVPTRWTPPRFGTRSTGS